jgi:hypothetical protein
MKYFKIIVFAVLLFSNTSVIAQNNFPTYYKVVKSFFTKYNYDSDQDYKILFAKKKEGWYVYLVDNLSEKNIQSSQLFWSSNSNSYKLLTFNLPVSKNKSLIEKNIEKYLIGSDWYNFDRSIYYGYNGYANDIINEFSNKSNLNDQELESLARAYTVKSNNYLWDQFGWKNYDNEIDNQQLKPNELPIREQVEKAKKCFDKSIEFYQLLAKRNQHFKTMVGDVNFKLANELMYFYDVLKTAGYDKDADSYLAMVNYSDEHIRQAKNRLNACLKNTILITAGDNDTYPLSYVQNKLKYRNDIRVINYTLLGIQPKLKRMKMEGDIAFSASDYFLNATNIEYALAENLDMDSLEDQGISISETLNSIYEYKMDSTIIQDIPQRTYPSKSFYLTVNSDLKFNFYANYLTLSDIILLDIVNSNINKTPIVFTSLPDNLFKEYTRYNNLHYEIITNSEPTNYDDVVNFKNKVFKPVISSEILGKKIISYDGDASLFEIYNYLIDHNIENENMDDAKMYLNELINFNTPKEVNSINLLILYSLYKTKQFNKIYPFIENAANAIKNQYFNPSPILGYLNKKGAIYKVDQLLTILKESKLKNDKILKIKQEIINSN